MLLYEFDDERIDELNGDALTPQEVQYITQQLELAKQNRVDMMKFGEWVRTKYGAPGLRCALGVMKKLGYRPDNTDHDSMEFAPARVATREDTRYEPDDDIPMVDAENLHDLAVRINQARNPQEAKMRQAEFDRYLNKIKGRHVKDGYLRQVLNMLKSFGKVKDFNFDPIHGIVESKKVKRNNPSRE